MILMVIKAEQARTLMSCFKRFGGESETLPITSIILDKLKIDAEQRNKISKDYSLTLIAESSAETFNNVEGFIFESCFSWASVAPNELPVFCSSKNILDEVSCRNEYKLALHRHYSTGLLSEMIIRNFEPMHLLSVSDQTTGKLETDKLIKAGFTISHHKGSEYRRLDKLSACTVSSLEGKKYQGICILDRADAQTFQQLIVKYNVCLPDTPIFVPSEEVKEGMEQLSNINVLEAKSERLFLEKLATILF
jgi:hypothetical protein